MKVAINGTSGQLGSALVRHLGKQAIPLSRTDGDLETLTEKQIGEILDTTRPDVFANSAAYTQVDKAELEIERAYQINASAVSTIAEACQKRDILFVQFSTDYVFTGSKQRTPFVESDPISPQGIYAASKAMGEAYAKSVSKHLILRTCGLYGHIPQASKSGNFVLTMLRLARSRDFLKIVNDQHCTPSYVEDVAQATIHLIKHCLNHSSDSGVYHLTNQGSTNWKDFAEQIFSLSGIPMKIQGITTEEYGAPAPRPSYSVLNTKRYHDLQLPPIPTWKVALKNFLTSQQAQKAA
ncbi:dTDP-4-dehydrorhamnose reductase [Planctomycetales bacterium 10988]|nr:dTDP-4-dehydrorhamnose reductase [Planctomycetales bacterium 10988]